MRESGNIKRRKVVGAAKRKAPQYNLSIIKGTTCGHYFQFLSDTMDIMDGFPEMKSGLMMLLLNEKSFPIDFFTKGLK